MLGVDLNRLYQFTQIVEAGNISKAALALKAPKSLVSRNLALLEQEVGVQLVYRTTRQFQITESGRALYESAISQFSDLQISLERLKQRDTEIQGSIRVTAPDDLGVTLLISVFDEFQRLYPSVRLEIEYSNETLDLVGRKLDLAVRIGRLRDSSLRKRSAGYVDNIVVGAPSVLKGRDPNQIKARDVESLPCVAFSVRGRVQRWVLRSKEKRCTIRPQPVLIVNNYLAVKEFILKGYGVGLMPRFLAESCLNTGVLVQLLNGWSTESVPVQVVLPQQKEPPKRIEIFSAFVAERLGALLK